MSAPTDDLVMPRSAEGRSFVTSYRGLLKTFIDAGFVFRTHAEGFVAPAPDDKSLFMRHDVDHKLNIALVMARIEHELGVRSSYYLLHPGDYDKDENYFGTIVDGHVVAAPGFMAAAHELIALGHEIGLHNDLAQLSVKTKRPIADLLTEIIEMFAAEGIRIAGTASHGSRFARKHEFVNYQIFAECLSVGSQPRVVNFDQQHQLGLYQLPFRQFGLSYEAYSIEHNCRIADTGGRFTVGSSIFEDVDFGALGEQIADKTRVVVLVHPDWWTEVAPAHELEIVADDRLAPPIFRRADRKPLRIAVRGDCCSRRMVAMNPAMFPDGVDIEVNEKCPNLAFVDSLSGNSVTSEELLELSETERMSASLRQYYMHQNERNVLHLRDLDLLVMDSYSDMNFELWEVRGRGCKLWVHPQFLRGDSAIAQSLSKVGRASFEESIRHVVAVIDHLRTLNPGLPVLFLPQPVDFYPKLAGRREFDHLGARVAELRAGVYAADPLPREELDPDDVGSCGPGMTLHFTGPTYGRMVAQAWKKGLMRHFDGTDLARAEVIATKLVALPPLPPPPSRSPSPSPSTAQSRPAAGVALRANGPFVRVRHVIDYARKFNNPLEAARWAAQRLWARVFGISRTPAVRPPSTPQNASAEPPPASPAVLGGAASEPNATAASALPALNANLEHLPRVTLSFQRDSHSCVDSCGPAVDRAYSSYREYFCFPAREATHHKRYKPMLLSFDELCDFAVWEGHIKSFGKGARLRQKNKAARLGYFFRQFAWPQFIPDIHAINHSKEVRSGGAMRGSYLRSVEEMGGAPSQPVPIVPPLCIHHWSSSFGVFLPEPGHHQGAVEVNERLVAYVVLQRTGEVLLYSMILGHGDHLANGVLILLHHQLVKWIGDQRGGLTTGVRYLMYGGLENGGESLKQWKRQAGFTPHLVDAIDAYGELGSNQSLERIG